MDDKILLLFVMLLLTVHGQTTTTSAPTAAETAELEMLKALEEGASPIYFVSPSSESTSQETEFTPNSQAESDEVKITPNSQAELGEDQNTPNWQEEFSEIRKENPEEVDVTLAESDPALMMLENLFDQNEKLLEESTNENQTSDQGDDTGLNYSIIEAQEEPIIASGSDQVAVRRQDETNAGLGRSSTAFGGYEETRNPEALSSSSPYEPKNDEFLRGEPGMENSPVLQLTAGGYENPFQPTGQLNEQEQKLKFDSATQQAEAVQTPNRNLNGQRSGRARNPQQMPFNPFLPPFGFTNGGPVFRHPLESQMTGMTAPNSAPRNSFYNTQPGFNQEPFSRLTNGGDFPVQFSVQTAPRAPMQNPAFLFQSPFQVPNSQSATSNNPGQMSPFFQSGGSPAYSNFESAMASPGQDYTALFGNVPPMHSHFHDRSNFYGTSPNFGRNIFTEPTSFMSNFPSANEGIQYSPRLLNYPPPTRGIKMTAEKRNPQLQNSDSLNEEKQIALINEAPKEESESLPFGTRIQQQNSGQERSDSERPNNVYMRYPMAEAGYATEDNLPTQNETTKRQSDNDTSVEQTFPFFTMPTEYNVFNGQDPYKIALENVQRGYPNTLNRDAEDKNDTNEFPFEQSIRNYNFGPNQLRPEEPTQVFRPYSERNPSPVFDPMALFPENSYQFFPSSSSIEDSKTTPVCAEKTNASVCFEDPEYPSNELIYALNSDPYLIERLVLPKRQQDSIAPEEQNSTENSDNSVCSSDIKYGAPLRLKNEKGDWKVIVNLDKSIGQGKFSQTIRMEICRGAGEPCNYVQEKSSCLQKYVDLKLLSWGPERGLHYDTYHVPIACSCMIEK